MDFSAASGSEAWFVRDGGGSGGTFDIYAYHLHSGVVDPWAFSEPDSDEVSPSIAVGPDGIPWAIWSQVPPLNPSQSRIQFTRWVGAGWSSPERIPEPLAINRPRIAVDSSNGKWIACIANDPASGPNSEAVWGLRWDGAAWGLPQRLSAPMGADSIVYQLSLATNRPPSPVAVWLQGSIYSVAPAEIATAVGNGTDWAIWERVGEPIDSVEIGWPDAAARGDEVWICYQRQVTVPPYVRNVFALHSIPPTTAVVRAEFVAEIAPEGVRLAWSVSGGTDVALLEVYRAEGSWQSSARPVGTERIFSASTPDILSKGSCVDRSVRPGQDLTYWLAVTRTTGEDLTEGPRLIRVPLRRLRSQLIGAKPNPGGPVTISGLWGSDRPTRLEIFDMAGHLVRTLSLASSREGRGPGEFQVRWDGHADSGAPASSGVYWVRITGLDRQSSPRIRVVLLR